MPTRDFNWAEGFESLYYATVVDPATWRDLEKFDITDGSIKRTDSDLRQSADISTVNYTPNNEFWIRIWLDARQDGRSSHTPLFTGLVSCPDNNIDGFIIHNTLECYSVLKAAEDVGLPRGWYAPVETNGAEMIRELLSVIPAPVRIVGNSQNLEQAIIAEESENHLTMVDKILTAIGWRLRITGYGEVIICEPAASESAYFSLIENDVIEPEMQISTDMYECPNVLVVISDDMTATARDDDPYSRFSTIVRGREVWRYETDATLNIGETLGEYATRRLKALQTYSTTATYDRRYDPDVLPTDLVRIHYPVQRIDGVFYISSQTIELGANAKTSEEGCLI